MEKIPPNLPFAVIGCINWLHRVGSFIRGEAASPREAEWASAAKASPRQAEKAGRFRNKSTE